MSDTPTPPLPPVPAHRAQTVFYPLGARHAALCSNIAMSPFCVRCNQDETQNNRGSDTDCANCWQGASDPRNCLPNGNTRCPSCQAYAQIFADGKIIEHHDVLAWPDYCAATGEVIRTNWTAINWNQIVANLGTAIRLGATQSAAGPNADSFPAFNVAPNQRILAEIYNQARNMVSLFAATGFVPQAFQNDVIQGSQGMAHATRLREGYLGAAFPPHVCDICNMPGAQRTACPCSCTCTCACSCPCQPPPPS